MGFLVIHRYPKAKMALFELTGCTPSKMSSSDNIIAAHTITDIMAAYEETEPNVSISLKQIQEKFLETRFAKTLAAKRAGAKGVFDYVWKMLVKQHVVQEVCA